jgi:cysteine desulfurase
MVYLDYSAHTPASQQVLNRFLETEQNYIGNANSKHTAGFLAKEKLDFATNSIAQLLNVLPQEIIYTSGATESNNLAIKGIARSYRHTGKHIISTSLEHSSVSAPLTALQEQGYEIDLLHINKDGKVDLDNLKELLRSDTILLTISAVDSELGTVQPVAEIKNILADYPNCRLHLDATQAVGKIPVDFTLADTVSFSAHKFYGINGSGILVKKKDLVIEPLLHGGKSTTIYRSGTPTLSLAVACECALNNALTNQPIWFEKVKELNLSLREFLSNYPKVKINSPCDSIPYILNLSVSGVKGSDFQKALSDKDICVSVKSACSVESLPSRAVFAVSGDRKNALSSWRISISHLTTDDDIEQFKSAFDACYNDFNV